MPRPIIHQTNQPGMARPAHPGAAFSIPAGHTQHTRQSRGPTMVNEILSSARERKYTPSGVPSMAASTIFQIERTSRDWRYRTNSTISRANATTATNGVATWIPIIAGKNAIATNAEPNPERLWVKTARKTTSPTNTIFISIAPDYSNITLEIFETSQHICKPTLRSCKCYLLENMLHFIYKIYSLGDKTFTKNQLSSISKGVRYLALLAMLAATLLATPALAQGNGTVLTIERLQG